MTELDQMWAALLERGGLILISHNQIIGTRYLAYVDPSTVPTLDAES